MRSPLRRSASMTDIIFPATEKESAAIAALSKRLDLSETAVIRQALRLYQMVQHRIDDGEVMTFQKMTRFGQSVLFHNSPLEGGPS